MLLNNNLLYIIKKGDIFTATIPLNFNEEEHDIKTILLNFISINDGVTRKEINDYIYPFIDTDDIKELNEKIANFLDYLKRKK